MGFQLSSFILILPYSSSAFNVCVLFLYIFVNFETENFLYLYRQSKYQAYWKQKLFLFRTEYVLFLSARGTGNSDLQQPGLMQLQPDLTETDLMEFQGT